MKNIFEAVRMWRYRRFVKTLPKAVQEPESFIDDIFMRDVNRRFNPFSSDDRHAIWRAVRYGQFQAFDKCEWSL
ncbi:hypothetical protein Ab1vBOLIVR4_gp63 [Agrobacterium phage OLIVR4]|nr:hypothetical protein Ab1vBOLIVR4_gp63 [Agrobacterium phage OLIVR4]